MEAVVRKLSLNSKNKKKDIAAVSRWQGYVSVSKGPCGEQIYQKVELHYGSIEGQDTYLSSKRREHRAHGHFSSTSFNPFNPFASPQAVRQQKQKEISESQEMLR